MRNVVRRKCGCVVVVREYEAYTALVGFERLCHQATQMVSRLVRTKGLTVRVTGLLEDLETHALYSA